MDSSILSSTNIQMPFSVFKDKTEKEKWCSMAGYRPSMKHN